MTTDDRQAATLGIDDSSQLTPLTVDFHEPGFVAAVNGENAFRQQKGFWFQLSDDDKSVVPDVARHAYSDSAVLHRGPLRYAPTPCATMHGAVATTEGGISYRMASPSRRV